MDGRSDVKADDDGGDEVGVQCFSLVLPDQPTPPSSLVLLLLLYTILDDVIGAELEGRGW